MANGSSDPCCPLCKGYTEPYLFGPNELSLRQCCFCTIVFLEDIIYGHEYVKRMEDRFFSKDYLVHQSSFQKLFDYLNACRSLRRIQQFKHSGRLLEIGIGSGAFLNTAKKAGFECFGMEPSLSVARYVRNVYNVVVFERYIEDFIRSPTESGFDVIVMNHVLEHISNPYTVLKQLRSLLAYRGILHVAVPNIDSWEARLPGWTSYEPYHLYYFSSKTLVRLLEEERFKVLRFETVEPFSGWFNALVRTVFGTRYQSARASAKGSREPGNASLRWLVISSLLNMSRAGFGLLTLPIRFIQGRLGKGEELVVVMTLD
jgi:2-polyprenyl-3-methyl-5-hydroxy-6-metoxy-1,4-benzoquinol methylase